MRTKYFKNLIVLNYKKTFFFFLKFFFESKKNREGSIVFVGCSGYGNIGDNSYPIILKKYLKEYKTIFLNSDPPRLLPPDCKYLVVGPGGMIYINKTAHFQYISEYMNQAIEREIPLIFLSCGVQSKNIESWKKYFDYASLITVRSKKCLESIRKISNNQNMHYYPDLVYLFNEYKKTGGLPKKYNLFIPVDYTKYDVQMFTKYFLETKPEERVVLTMGSQEENKKVFEYWKSVGNYIEKDKVIPEEVNYIIKNAKKVYTYRYHGLIFSRVNNVEYNTCKANQLKILNEDRNSNFSEAIKHILKLKELINKNKIKNIAILHDDFSVSGGGEKLISILAKGLKDKGFNIDIYTFNVSENTKKIIDENLNIIKIKDNTLFSNDDTIKRYLFSKLNLKNRYDLYIYSGHSSICSAYNNKPNIMYCHNIPGIPLPDKISYTEKFGQTDKREIYRTKREGEKKKYSIGDTIEKVWFFLFVLKNKITEKQIIPDFIGIKIDALRLLFSNYKKIERKDVKIILKMKSHLENIRHIEKIITNSKNIKNKVKFYYKRESDVIYPPIETKKYKNNPSENYWLSINRIVPLKRIEKQISAFSKLPNEKLIIVGDLENKKYYEYLLSIKPKNVSFVGVINEDEKIELLSKCKGFIFTAKDEDFGMSVVEAMASGKPVIAPNEGGCIETIINKKTGILIQKISPRSIMSAIKNINKNLKTNPNRYKNECIKQAEKFDKQSFINNFISLINNL